MLYGPVVAGFPAGRAVEEAVSAKTNIDLALAKTAELFALALCLRSFTLHANNFFGSSGA